MSSTSAVPRSSQPQLSEQSPMDRPDKRPYPGSPSQEDNGQDHYSEDEEENAEDDQQSIRSHETRDSSSQPPTKTRKKPGRKPNPASPAVRKEQNRAAQRAFRDRKERHLQQLENTIKELKDSQHHSTLRFQRESQQLKNIIESLQSENYYLREVVFSFESALSKGGNTAILQDVKAELYRRHYETHTARKLSLSHPSPQDHQQPSPAPSSLANDSPVTATAPAPVDDAIPQAAQVQMLNQALAAAVAANAAAVAAATAQSGALPLNSAANSWNQMGLADPQDDNIFSMNSEILYRAPPVVSSNVSEDGKPTTPTPTYESTSTPRQVHSSPAAWPPKQTDYSKNNNMFETLQPSFFSGTHASSGVQPHMNPAQEVSNDMSMFSNMQENRAPLDPTFSPAQNMFTFTGSSMDSAFPQQAPTYLDADDVDSNEFSMATPSLHFDDELKQNAIPTHRLQNEIRALAAAPPAVDPNVDPKIYQIAHDTRIDLIPCPKLRAQMILYQNQYDIEDLCQLLMGGAICHGDPLDPHNWELPRAFFDRYGYLMGQELMRYKYKVWPKKDQPQQRRDFFRNF